ncbi:MAG: cbb3-type cytochrome oxidase assembly protein CcoS [Bacteroidota bacterium]
MSALYVLIGFSLLIALGFFLSFIWAVKSGQYEDDYSPSVRMLFEDESLADVPTSKANQKPLDL